MKQKRWFMLATAMLLVLAFAATACTGSPTASPSPSMAATPNETTDAPPVTTGTATAATTPADQSKTIRLSTTTSVNDSGLLGYLQPLFEQESGYKLEIISNGSGAAIKLGESGDADCLLVHSKDAEEKFVADGYGVERKSFMYNYFVIAGPKDDTAKVKSAKSAGGAFKAIADKKADFVSRGDDSGTHNAEKKLWEAADVKPGGDWYISAGAGMGACLNQANEREAYILTDKATFLSMRDNLPNLEILLEKSDEMKNTYSLIAVDPKKNPGVNKAGADAFVEWMTRKDTLDRIAAFGKDKYGEALFYLL